MMTYKGYTGVVEFDDEAHIFHGEVLGINDVVTFQGTTVKELEKAFKNSVDDYLAFCAERNEEPNKPFSGKFMVRLTPEQHRQCFIAAKKRKKSVNAWITDLIQKAAVL